MKKLLALLLAVVMLFALAACGDSGAVKDEDPPKTTTAPVEEDTLEGEWVTTLAVTGEMMGADGLDTEVAITLMVRFDEDTYTMYVDQDALEDSIDAFVEDMTDFMIDMVYDGLMESGMSKEEADAMFEMSYGMTVEEYCVETVEELDLQGELGSMNEEMEEAGDYTVDGDTLTLISEDEEVEYTFVLDGDKLTLSSEDEDFLDTLEQFQLEEMVFTRK